jgi:hypothetical protein
MLIRFKNPVLLELHDLRHHANHESRTGGFNMIPIYICWEYSRAVASAVKCYKKSSTTARQSPCYDFKKHSLIAKMAVQRTNDRYALCQQQVIL